MSEALGLSIGVANLVATRSGGGSLARTPVLTLFDHRPSEVGLPGENPNLTEPGLVLRGFVERVGDPAPLVAADGTKYLGQALTIEALEAMARSVGYGTPITVAVPAYWSESQVAALRQELFAQPDLSARGGPPTLISDAAAGLAALNARPGFPRDGVVALCDFGAGGTSVTLADAADSTQIGSTFRFSEFSGDDIDQLILNHLLAVSPAVDSTEGSVTSTRMGSMTRLLGGCREAKEQLSVATVATLAAGAAEVRLERTEFDRLISGPLDGFLTAVEQHLRHDGIDQLAAVAAVGGGAGIPLISARLSERLQAPVFTAPQPQFSAAIGAAALGQHRSSPEAPTDMAPAAGVATGVAAAVSPPTEAAPIAGAAPTEAMPGSTAETDRALAWSEDSGTGMEPVPYTGPAEYAAPVEPVAAPAVPDGTPDHSPADAEPPVWYRRPAILLSLAGAGAAVLLAVVLALTLGPTSTKPVVTTSQPPPVTTDVIGPDNLHTTTVITPPPVTETATTTTPPPPASSSPATSTTSTTSTPSTTSTTTSTTPPPTTTQPTTTNPPPTSAPPTTTSAAPAPPTTSAAPAPPTTSAAPAPPTSAAPGA